MKIEKIKNYNSYLLAIAGTIGCIFLLGVLVMAVAELFPRSYYDADPHGLIADDKTEILNQENLRKQIISYESPWLIDTLQAGYIIPVSIKTLKKPEEVINEYDDGLFALMDTNPFSSKKGYRYRRYLNGTYANLIVYKPKENITKSIFNERLVIGNIQIYYFDDDILLVFDIASKDTNKNGIIDLGDTTDLCIYSMKTDQIRKIVQEGDEIQDYTFIENSKDILIRFRLGEYEPNQFDNQESPGKILKYDYETDRLVNIIPQDIQQQMQKLVEGK